ncbi:inositol monophosphatase family protein [Nonomuraea ferruginea]
MTRPSGLCGCSPSPRSPSGSAPRVVSTTLAVAWVAAMRRAAYVTDGHLQDSVHFAAGIALCRAAGCVVTDLHGLAAPHRRRRPGRGRRRRDTRRLAGTDRHPVHCPYAGLLTGRSS